MQRADSHSSLDRPVDTMHQISKRSWLVLFLVILLNIFLIMAQDDFTDTLTKLEERQPRFRIRPPCFGASCVRRRRANKKVFKTVLKLNL